MKCQGMKEQTKGTARYFSLWVKFGQARFGQLTPLRLTVRYSRSRCLPRLAPLPRPQSFRARERRAEPCGTSPARNFRNFRPCPLPPPRGGGRGSIATGRHPKQTKMKILLLEFSISFMGIGYHFCIF